MPTKRLKKRPSTAKKPQSTPLSEINASVADGTAGVEGPDAQERGSTRTSPSAHHDDDNDEHLRSAPWEEEDEEMPEAPENTVQPGRSEYAVGAGGYNMLKSYKGQVYSGMAVGGSHTWNYDQGLWKETKEEPDLWRIDYQTNKRRARRAPEGSGAPVGTEYHWLIVAHQVCPNHIYKSNWIGPSLTMRSSSRKLMPILMRQT
jgi:hypothetical protein